MSTNIDDRMYQEKIDTTNSNWAKTPNVLSRRLNEIKSNLLDSCLTKSRHMERIPEYPTNFYDQILWPRKSVPCAHASSPQARESGQRTDDGRTHMYVCDTCVYI